MNVCAFGTQPTDGVVDRIPTNRFVRSRGAPVCRLVDPLVIVRRTLATSPGSALPSGTLAQTPVPGCPGLSQVEFNLLLHFSGMAGSLPGFGSPAVQIGSAVPSSES